MLRFNTVIALVFVLFLGGPSCDLEKIKPTIKSVETVCEPSRMLIINGKEFETAMYRNVACSGGTPPSADDNFEMFLENEIGQIYQPRVVSWKDMSELTAKVPDEAPNGTYQLTVTDPYGNTDTKEMVIDCTEIDTGTDTDSESDTYIDTATEDDTGVDVDSDIDTDTDVDTDTDTGFSGCVIVVNAASSVSSPKGLRWTTAYSRVQDGIDAAYSKLGSDQDVCEVWVAEGKYYIYEKSPKDTVQLMPQVKLYGGFLGTETTRDERDWKNNKTILTGYDFQGGTNQVYHVTTGSDEAVIDGFTITGGNASSEHDDFDSSGGGMINYSSSPEVSNCIFSTNSARFSGGGMYNHLSYPVVTGCSFIHNSSNQGGGIDNLDSSPTITNCVFARNSATYEGGAINNNNSSPTVGSSTFVLNQADSGGGIFYSNSSSVSIINSIFWNNVNSQIATKTEAVSDVTYSDVQDGHYGRGNIDADPMFVDFIGNDMHLLKSSPCIDAAKGKDAPTLDIEGNNRADIPDVPNKGLGPPWADIGAYEHTN